MVYKRLAVGSQVPPASPAESDGGGFQTADLGHRPKGLDLVAFLENHEPLAPGPRYEHGPGQPSLEKRWGTLLNFNLRYRGRTNPGIAGITAEKFIELGFWPILIAPGGKSPLFDGWKTQPPSRGHWEWADRKMPGAGVALMLGAAGGLVDLDVDDPELAVPTLAALFPHGVPNTLGWTTSRGYHLIFRYEPRLAVYPKSVIRLPGVELKIGHPDGVDKALHAVIPPSRTAGGTPRLWNDGRGVWPLPESVFAFLAREAPASPPARGRFAAAEEAQKRNAAAPAGRRRRGGRGRPDAEARAVLYLAKCQPAVMHSNGSDACFTAACFVGPGFDLPEETMIRIMLKYYNPRCDPPWAEWELRHKVADAYATEARRGWLLNESRPR